jgi:hypothetical protein
MTVNERAMQIWPVLLLAARNRQSLTYEILGQLVGVPAQGLGQCLEPIQAYCKARGLPALTSVVVQKDSGLPGIGFTAAADVPGAHAHVFNFDWTAERCPSVDSLQEASDR